MRTVFLTLFLCFVAQHTFSQTLHYDVVKGSKKLGDMTVKRTSSEGGIYYEIDSKVTFRILFAFTVDYESTSEYKNGRLIKEYTHSELNGSTQKESIVWFDGQKYTHDQEGVRNTFERRVNYSVAAIYFREPRDGQKVYSPQFGADLQFQRVEDGVYELDSPDGLNVYHYTNGICTKVRVFRDFAKFSFDMTPESLVAVRSRKIVGGSTFVD